MRSICFCLTVGVHSDDVGHCAVTVVHGDVDGLACTMLHADKLLEIAAETLHGVFLVSSALYELTVLDDVVALF